MVLDEVSADCRRRLVGHYGPTALGWIERAPSLLEAAATRWGLSVVAYHDAGHASIVATAVDGQDRTLLLKAWTDPHRYRHEISALRLWAGGPAADLVASADDLAVAALELVGDRPGGSDRPDLELPPVAEALHKLHSVGLRNRPDGLPRLSDYIRDEVTPRVWTRLRDLDLARWGEVARVGLCALGEPWRRDSQVTVLHGDLYRENVLFSAARGPVFVDPLPMLGPAAFDWAFWVVYYEVGCGVDDRMSLALQVSGLPERDLRRWCSVLFLDGLLYYLETTDPRASLFGDIAEAFALNCHGSRA